jgi:hypothetical protein
MEAKKKAARKKPAKKGGPKKPTTIAGIKISDIPPALQALAGHIAHTAPELQGGEETPDVQKKQIVKKFFATHRTPDVRAMYYTPDDAEYLDQQTQGNLLAAALHLIHGISPAGAKQVGADFAAVAHHEAGEKFRAADQVARDVAHDVATSTADATAGMFHSDPQRGRAKGGPTTDDPEDIETKRAARSARPSGGPPPPEGEEYAPEYPGEPEPPGAPAKPKRKFGLRARQRGVQHDRPGARTWQREPEEPEKQKKVATPYRGSEFTSPQRTGDKMTYEQFEQFLDDHMSTLGPQEIKDVMQGIGKSGHAANAATAIAHLKELAGKRADLKDYKSIADAQKQLWGRIDAIHTIRQNELQMRRAWDANLRILSKMPVGDQQAYKMALERTKVDPKARDQAASLMNKLVDRAYDLETQTLKIGKNELTTFVRKVTLPQFKRSDYETMRMAEQMGLAAIHKQHQYGKGYGRWNTIMLFLRQILTPFVLWYSRNPKLIKPIMALWPQEALDAFYFAFVQKNLPKLRKGDPGQLQPSRDTKFLRSQKMATGRRKRIMRGWEQDMPMPPDQAVLHTRWYPTTKETWGKRRQAELTARYEKTKARPPKVTRKSFL